MSLLTRIKVTGVVVTLAIAAGVIAFRDEWGRPDPRTDVEEAVTVHAQWFRSRGTKPIEVTITAEGVPLLEDSLVVSPFARTFNVPKGVIVTAVFFQPTGGELKCRVDRPSRVGETKSRETAGRLTCTG